MNKFEQYLEVVKSKQCAKCGQDMKIEHDNIYSTRYQCPTCTGFGSSQTIQKDPKEAEKEHFAKRDAIKKRHRAYRQQLIDQEMER